MKLNFFEKSSLRLGVVASSLYLTASVCPCCGRPSAGCLAGLGGALFLGGGVWGINFVRLYIKNKIEASGLSGDPAAK